MFNLAVLHEAIAAAIPERECLIFRDRRLSWGDVTDRTRRLADVLRRHGLGCHRERGELANWENHLGDWGLTIAMVLHELRSSGADFDTLTLDDLDAAYRKAQQGDADIADNEADPARSRGVPKPGVVRILAARYSPVVVVVADGKNGLAGGTAATGTQPAGPNLPAKSS